MGDDITDNGAALAQEMVDLLASVGATLVDVTVTTKGGDKESFRRNITLKDFRANLTTQLDATRRCEHNLIVRPHGPGVTFIQLDDLKADQLGRLAPAVFLALETSPGNFQAWVAMQAADDKDFARRLRKGVGADPTASGATRIAGSLNFKDKYAPDYPRVAIHAARSGRLTTAETLDRLGLVTAPEIVAKRPLPSPTHARPGARSRKWPSYARCLDGAPLNSEETGPDTSRADFVFCMIAITWGWSAEETAMRLMEESSKAQTNGKAYAELTARNAALAVERRTNPPKPQKSAEHGRR